MCLKLFSRQSDLSFKKANISTNVNDFSFTQFTLDSLDGSNFLTGIIIEIINQVVINKYCNFFFIKSKFIRTQLFHKRNSYHNVRQL